MVGRIERRRHVPLDVGAQRRLPAFDYASNTAVYFVTIRAEGTATPFVDDRLAQDVLTSLDWLRRELGVRIYALCLMPDHLHLLLQLGGTLELGQVLGRFKSFTTKQYRDRRHTGSLWQGRFYDHILRREEDARTFAEYIRQNPVRRGMVSDPGEYPYTALPDPL